MLIGIAHALFIFLELAFVESLIEQVLEENGVRDSDRMRVLHRLDHLFLREHMVSDDGDVTYLHLRTFIDIKNDFE